MIHGKEVYHHIIMDKGVVHVISNGTNWPQIQRTGAEYSTGWISGWRGALNEETKTVSFTYCISLHETTPTP